MSPILTEEELAKYKNQSADYEKKIAERDAAIERQQKENEAIENKKTHSNNNRCYIINSSFGGDSLGLYKPIHIRNF